MGGVLGLGPNTEPGALSSNSTPNIYSDLFVSVNSKLITKN